VSSAAEYCVLSLEKTANKLRERLENDVTYSTRRRTLILYDSSVHQSRRRNYSREKNISQTPKYENVTFVSDAVNSPRWRSGLEAVLFRNSWQFHHWSIVHLCRVWPTTAYDASHPSKYINANALYSCPVPWYGVSSAVFEILGLGIDL